MNHDELGLHGLEPALEVGRIRHLTNSFGLVADGEEVLLAFERCGVDHPKVAELSVGQRVVFARVGGGEHGARAWHVRQKSAVRPRGGDGPDLDECRRQLRAIHLHLRRLRADVHSGSSNHDDAIRQLQALRQQLLSLGRTLFDD